MVNLKNINFMSEERFNSLTETSEDELYAVETDWLLDNKITNCLIHIPQDIKLELNDGTLTLKAGSKVYVPNGAGVFDIITISADRTETASSMGLTTGSALVFSRFDTQDIWAEVLTESGTGTPTNPWTTYYNTNENKVYRYQTNITTPVYQSSFPIAKISFSNGTITSINQIFNGFGYIGSTVFALPGVRGLTPNGRNADGSLKNTEFVTDKVIVSPSWNDGQDRSLFLFLSSDNILRRTYTYNYFVQKNTPSVSTALANWYNPEENIMYAYEQSTNKWNRAEFICVGNYLITINSNVSYFNPKTTFQAVDRNDTSWLSGLDAPSNRYIDLTLGASGATYTAPASGYYYTRLVGTSGNYFYLRNRSASSIADGGTFGAKAMDVSVRVKKGDEVYLVYNGTISTVEVFRFIYAEGEN